ncbi:MAG: hypothetical protein N2512_15290 [Armatimonadetes bacterium]|nr:hypothetical protein [Armatimonadota bacterium]
MHTTTAYNLPARRTPLGQRYWYPRPLLITAAAVGAVFATSGAAAQVALWGLAAAAVAIALTSSVEGLAMLMLVSAVDGISKGVLPGWFTLLLKDVVLWTCVLRWLFLQLQGFRSQALRTRTAGYIALFAIWVFIEAANVATGNALVALAGVRSWIGWLPVFFLAYDHLRRRREIVAFLITMVAAAAVVGLYGVVQQQIGYGHLLNISRNFEYVYRLGITEGVYRSIGTLPHPGIFGHYMATMLPMALSLGLASFLPAGVRAVCLVATVFIAAGAISSGGRLAAAAMLSTAVLVFLLGRHARTIIGGIIILSVIGYVSLRLAAPQAVERISWLFRAETTIDRVLTPLSRGWQSALRHPLGVGVATGIGIGRAAELLGDVGRVSPVAAGIVEGEFGRAFRELGFPGGFLVIALCVHVAWAGFSAFRATLPPEYRFVSAGLLAMVVSEILGLFVGPAFYLMPVAGLFWIAIASLLRIGSNEDLADAAPATVAPAAQALRQLAQARNPGPTLNKPRLLR